MPDQSNDERAIRNVIETWHSATRAGDTAIVLSLLADDALFLVAGVKPFGKSEFAASSEKLKGTAIDSHGEIREIEIAGNLAFCRTELDVKMTTPDGQTHHRKGPTLTIFRKKPDGTWQLYRDANLLTEV